MGLKRGSRIFFGEPQQALPSARLVEKILGIGAPEVGGVRSDLQGIEYMTKQADEFGLPGGSAKKTTTV